MTGFLDISLELVQTLEPWKTMTIKYSLTFHIFKQELSSFRTGSDDAFFNHIESFIPATKLEVLRGEIVMKFEFFDRNLED